MRDAFKPAEPKTTCTVAKEKLEIFMYFHNLFIPPSFGHKYVCVHGNQKVQK
jgi:hypothetical protein